MFRNTLCEAEPDEPRRTIRLRRDPHGNRALRTSAAAVKRINRPAGPRTRRNTGCRTYRTSRGDAPNRRAESGYRNAGVQFFPAEFADFGRHGNRTDGCGSHPASAAGSSNRKNPVPASCENPLRTAQDDNRMPISTLSVPTARNRKAILNDVSASESRTVPSNDS